MPSWFARLISAVLFCAVIIPVATVRGQWTDNPSVNTPVCTAPGDQVQPKIRNAAGVAYDAAANTCCPISNGDLNHDTFIDGLDAAGFVDALVP